MIEKIEKYETLKPKLGDLGLLILRVSIPLLMIGAHGWGKLSSFGDLSTKFPDPLGVGSGLSLTLAVIGEFFAPLLLILGLATRAAAVPLLITMLVAALIVHGDDPFNKKELGLMYAIPALTLIFTGGGRYSLDAVIWPNLRERLANK